MVCVRARLNARRRTWDATGQAGQVTCRFTHVYPDGPAPYFTFHAAGRHGKLIEQWHAIKSAGLDAVIAAAAQSRITTRSAATTGPGTTASARRYSQRR